MHEADDSIVQARLLRESTKVQTEDTFELKQARKKGDLTEVELADALKRLTASGTWSFQDFEKQISESQVLEDIHEQELMRIADYMRVRPQEIKNELFKVRHKLMKKREKEDERQRLEAKRLKDVADHEERRAAEKRREEKREEKELFRERTCGKCGQVYTNDKNRGGQCVHKGEWANWGEDSKGQKVEWLFYWTCCKSQTYEGPASGHSCCSRSGMAATAVLGVASTAARISTLRAPFVAAERSRRCWNKRMWFSNEATMSSSVIWRPPLRAFSAFSPSDLSLHLQTSKPQRLSWPHFCSMVSQASSRASTRGHGVCLREVLSFLQVGDLVHFCRVGLVNCRALFVRVALHDLIEEGSLQVVEPSA